MQIRPVVDHADSLWDACDPVSPIPEDLEVFLPPRDLLQERLVKADADYGADCSRMLFETLVDLKTKRYPRAPCWQDRVPMFLSGGASPMGFYREAVEHISTKLTRLYAECSGIERMSLTKPEPLEADGISDDTYHRIAVAWGLSYPDTDIGGVTRPTDIDDIGPRKVADHSSREISKDQV